MKRISIPLDSGITLSALEGGDGHPLIMIPGWSQTAAEWSLNAEAITSCRRVIALDMRGHGESDTPGHGYRVYRLAKDLHEVLESLALSAVDLMGHSMGCAVIWAYLDLYGPSKVERLVLVDQAPCMLPHADWEAEEKSHYGCFYEDSSGVDEFAAVVNDSTDLASTVELLKGLFNPCYPEDSLRMVAEENIKFPREHASELLRDTAFGDWRDVIERIELPTLVIGGETSMFPSASQQWISSKITGSRLEIFTEAEGGSHFMFLENPDLFNAKVLSFLVN
tara:strand:+ start:358 stop:1197 length:840 start_codon:yes stop_codon:yes gene_type:complete